MPVTQFNAAHARPKKPKSRLIKKSALLQYRNSGDFVCHRCANHILCCTVHKSASVKIKAPCGSERRGLKAVECVQLTARLNWEGDHNVNI